MHLLVTDTFEKGRCADQKISQYLVLAGTGKRCRTRLSGVSQTYSMGDMSGEYAGHGRTFSASRNCVQNRSLRHWAINDYAET